ncbi:MAG: hypothetical protein ACOX0Z_01240 [Candidatus Nanosyncoccaceae bacterium]|jgi:hypothetical protein
MEWWRQTKYFWLIGLVILFASLINPYQAIAVVNNNLECVDVDGNIICPDLYCATNTITCDSDIKQCYCQPVVLGKSSTDNNAFCEIATGSEIYFTRSSGSNKVNSIVLKNGLWGSLARHLSRIYKGYDLLNRYDIHAESEAIIFRPEDPSSNDTTQYYRSRFLNLFKEVGMDPLKNDFDNYFGTAGLSDGVNAPVILNTSTGNLGIGFYAHIESDSDSGLIYNQMFDAGTGEHRQLCGAHTLENGKTFFQKASGVNFVENLEETACLGVPDLLIKLVLPAGQDNDVAGLVESSLLARAKLTRTCVGFKIDEKKILWFNWETNSSINDPFALAGQLIVPINEQRPVYQNYIENQYMGIVFNGKPDGETAEQREQRKANRKKAVARLRQKCLECQNYSRAGTIVPPYCELCSGEVLASLSDDSLIDKPYSAIVAQELRRNNCQVITPSFGQILGRLSGGHPKSEYNGNARLSKNSKTEAELNKSLPESIIKICEENFGDKTNDRLTCKTNGLQCYIERISPNLRGKDICHFMDKSEALRRGRWIFCPVLKTEVLAADKMQEMINQVFSISPNMFADARIEKIWETARDIANVLLIISFIFVILSQVTGIGLSNYQIKTLLPKILASALLINLSFIITRLGVEISNILGGGMADIINDISAGLVGTDSSSFEFLIFRASGSVLIMAGVLALALPVLLIAIFGVFSLLVLLALRKVILIILILAAPLAFGVAGLPSGEKFTKKWWRAFMTLLAIYPVAQLTYSASKLTSLIMSSVSHSGDGTAGLVKIVAAVLPYVSIIFIPTIIKMLFNSVSKITTNILSGSKTATTAVQTRLDNKIRKSHLRRNVFGFAGRAVTDTLAGNTAWQHRAGNRFRKFAGRQLDRVGELTGREFKRAKEWQEDRPRSSWLERVNTQNVPFTKGRRKFNLSAAGLLNAVSFGAGRNIARGMRSTNMTSKNSISTIIGNDMVLLRALIMEQGNRGYYYNQLSESRQKQYDLVVNQDRGQMHNLAAVAPVLLAKNGVTDQALYQKAIDNAQALGISKTEYIGLTYGTAKSGTGDVEVMGIIRSHMTIKPRDVIASNVIQKATTDLENKSVLRRYIIENSGNMTNIAADAKSPAWTGLSQDLSMNATASKIQGLNQRDLLTAAIDAEAKDPNTSQASYNLITTGLTNLASLSGSFVYNAKGEIDMLTGTKLEDLSYALTTFELVNQTLKNNGVNGLAPIELDNLKVLTTQNGQTIEVGIKDLKFDMKTNKDTVDGLVTKITKGHRDAPLPEGWSEDRRENRAPTKYDLYKTYDKEITSIPVEQYYSRLFDDTRTPDRNIGATTTHFARERILDKIGETIDLSTTIDNYERRRANPDTPKEADFAVMNHIIYNFGRSWNQLPPSIQTAVSEPIVESIYRSIESNVRNKYPEVTGPIALEEKIRAIYGVRTLEDAKRAGPVGMFQAIGIEPEEIAR